MGDGDLLPSPLAGEGLGERGLDVRTYAPTLLTFYNPPLPQPLTPMGAPICYALKRVQSRMPRKGGGG